MAPGAVGAGGAGPLGRASAWRAEGGRSRPPAAASRPAPCSGSWPSRSSSPWSSSSSCWGCGRRSRPSLSKKVRPRVGPAQPAGGQAALPAHTRMSCVHATTCVCPGSHSPPPHPRSVSRTPERPGPARGWAPGGRGQPRDTRCPHCSLFCFAPPPAWSLSFSAARMQSVSERPPPPWPRRSRRMVLGGLLVRLEHPPPPLALTAFPRHAGSCGAPGPLAGTAGPGEGEGCRVHRAGPQGQAPGVPLSLGVPGAVLQGWGAGAGAPDILPSDPCGLLHSLC